MAHAKPHVVIFFGGTSDSHDLSQETGYWLANYISRSNYQVTPVRITPEGDWQVPLGGLPQSGPVDRMLQMLFTKVRSLTPVQGLERLMRKPIHALMTTVRGAGGDDGSLHTLGSTLHIPVVGSPAHTCQVTSHKQLCAASLASVVNTPLTISFRATDPPESIAEAAAEHLTAPFLIKPASEEGSSGVEEVATVAELIPALQRAQRKGDGLLQERVAGTELNVTLFEDNRGVLQMLPPTVIVPQQAKFYDQLAKRRAGRVTLHTPAADNPVLWQAEAIARDVYRELGCEGYASLDFISGPAGLDLLEVNTIPTYTAMTPLKTQLHAAGLHPTTLVDHLVSRVLQEA